MKFDTQITLGTLQQLETIICCFENKKIVEVRAKNASAKEQKEDTDGNKHHNYAQELDKARIKLWKDISDRLGKSNISIDSMSTDQKVVFQIEPTGFISLLVVDSAISENNDEVSNLFMRYLRCIEKVNREAEIDVGPLNFRTLISVLNNIDNDKANDFILKYSESVEKPEVQQDNTTTTNKLPGYYNTLTPGQDLTPGQESSQNQKWYKGCAKIFLAAGLLIICTAFPPSLLIVIPCLIYFYCYPIYCHKNSFEN